MSDDWYYKSESGSAGPFKWLEMVFLVNNRTILAGTLIRKGANGRWVRASKNPGLSFTDRKNRSRPLVPAPVAESPLAPATSSVDKPLLGAQVHLAATQAGLPSELVFPVAGAAVLAVIVLFALTVVIRPKQQIESRLVDSSTVGQPQQSDGPGTSGSVSNEGRAVPPLSRVENAEKPNASGNVDPKLTSTEPINQAADGKHDVRSISDIVAECEPSVALIKGKSSSGTGFLVGRGLLATNRHVVEGEFVENLSVSFPSAKSQHRGPSDAELLYIDPSRDLALLSVRTNLPAIKLANTSRVRKGEEVIAIGSPGAPTDDQLLLNAISRGLVSSHTTIAGHELLQLDISINPGNSGGPVIGMGGGVLGVATSRTVDEEGLGFCEPVDGLRAAIHANQSQSGHELAELRAYHRARTAYRKTADAATAYRHAMSIYADVIDDAVKRDNDIDDAVHAAKEKIGKPLGQIYKVASADLETAIEKVVVDAQLPAELRERFVDFWANFSELKSYVDRPRGMVAEFRKKFQKLIDNHDRLSESLRLLLGIPKAN